MDEKFFHTQTKDIIQIVLVCIRDNLKGHLRQFEHVSGSQNYTIYTPGTYSPPNSEISSTRSWFNKIPPASGGTRRKDYMIARLLLLPSGRWTKLSILKNVRSSLYLRKIFYATYGIDKFISTLTK